jgi:hypothetical protein
MRFLLVPFLFSLYSAFGFAQNLVTLQLIDRPQKTVELISLNDSSIFYKVQGKSRILEMERYKIYKIIYPENNGTAREVLIYKTDTLEGNTLSAEQMADYMKGQEDAYKGYRNKNLFPVLFGFGVGFVSPLAGFVYGPLGPIASITTQSVLPVKKKENWGFNPEFKNNEYYIGGYERAIRRKNMRRNGIATACGFLTGAAAFTILIRSMN